MAKEQTNQQSNKARAGVGRFSGELAQLSSSYAAFRRAHQPRMRIPEELRKAALDAIGRGIPEKLVREACRISLEQLNRWQEIERVGGRGKRKKHAKPRVFKVVDSPLEKGVPDNRKETASGPVHLRVGEWEICIRQVVR